MPQLPRRVCTASCALPVAPCEMQRALPVSRRPLMCFECGAKLTQPSLQSAQRGKLPKRPSLQSGLAPQTKRRHALQRLGQRAKRRSLLRSQRRVQKRTLQLKQRSGSTGGWKVN